MANETKGNRFDSFWWGIVVFPRLEKLTKLGEHLTGNV